MNTQEFLEALSAQPNQALMFEYSPGQRIKPGYHVTEVMNASYQSMDCGGQPNAWQQTVVQLMGPNRLDKPEYMDIQKFLGIYGRVAAAVPIQPEAELRFEYGDAELPAIHYHVGRIQSTSEGLVVHLTPPGVTCKASDRRIAASTCCEPVANLASNVVWADSAPSKCC